MWKYFDKTLNGVSVGLAYIGGGYLGVLLQFNLETPYHNIVSDLWKAVRPAQINIEIKTLIW